jgi:hypothetical protein
MLWQKSNQFPGKFISLLSYLPELAACIGVSGGLRQWHVEVVVSTWTPGGPHGGGAYTTGVYP